MINQDVLETLEKIGKVAIANGRFQTFFYDLLKENSKKPLEEMTVSELIEFIDFATESYNSYMSFISNR